MREGRTDSWSRYYFERVADSVRALRRAERIAQARSAREATLYDPTKPSQGGPRPSGASDPMAKVDAALDERAEDPEWVRDARATVESFDALMDELRASCSGALLEATFCAEYRYRLTYSLRQTAAALELSTTTVSERVATLADYLDHIGPSAVPSAVR